MKLADLKSLLQTYPQSNPRFILPDGDQIPAHAHVTEVGYSRKTFIDCGGVTGQTEAVVLQTHVMDDTEHRLTSERLSKILHLAHRVLPHDQVDVEVEYDCCVVAQYPITEAKLTGDSLEIALASKRTQCLARERAQAEAETSCCAGACS